MKKEEINIESYLYKSIGKPRFFRETSRDIFINLIVLNS